jgi:hypothetical protein
MILPPDSCTSSNPLGPRAARRNEIVYGRIAAYDVEFTRFQQDINRERTLSDTTGTLTALALTALGASFTATSTKTALIAATGAVTGATAAIDKNLFYNQTLPALFALMQADRTKILLDIDNDTRQCDASIPLTRLLALTDNYREAGSIPGALASLTGTAGNKKMFYEYQFQVSRTGRPGYLPY